MKNKHYKFSKSYGQYLQRSTGKYVKLWNISKDRQETEDECISSEALTEEVISKSTWQHRLSKNEYMIPASRLLHMGQVIAFRNFVKIKIAWVAHIGPIYR